MLADSGPGAERTWTLRLRATDYGIFHSRSNCTPPPFGRTEFNYDNHLWEANVKLAATGGDQEHTVVMSVAADPGHAAHESWTGTVTLTGIF